MTRRDCILIARTIRRLPFAPARIEHIALAFAGSIAAEYPAFRRDKFLQACGVTPAHNQMEGTNS